MLHQGPAAWKVSTAFEDLFELPEEIAPGLLPFSLLGKMLLYALHTASDLDAQAIYTRLSTDPELEKSTMSVAEKLIAQGLSQGLSKGLWFG